VRVMSVCVCLWRQLREAILLYLHELILDMEADELVNSSALQMLLLRVVLWSVEPQSNKVRDVSQSYKCCIIALSALTTTSSSVNAIYVVNLLRQKIVLNVNFVTVYWLLPLVAPCRSIYRSYLLCLVFKLILFSVISGY